MFTAKHHLRIGTKTFRPGDEIPPELMSDEVWKRLYQKGAIQGTPDPVEAVLGEDEENTPHQPPSSAASPQGEASEGEADKAAKAATEDQAEEPKAEVKKASGKKASGSKAKPAEKEPDLPLIDAGALVVDTPKGKKVK